MRAARALVHRRRRLPLARVAGAEEVERLAETRLRHRRPPLAHPAVGVDEVDAARRVDVAHRLPALQQIVHSRAIHLDVRDREQRLNLGRSRVERAEHLGDDAADDAEAGRQPHVRLLRRLSEHRVRLARARLAVDQHAAVDAVDQVDDRAARRLLIHRLLRRLLVKRALEAERPQPDARRHREHLARPLLHGQNRRHRRRRRRRRRVVGRRRRPVGGGGAAATALPPSVAAALPFVARSGGRAAGSSAGAGAGGATAAGAASSSSAAGGGLAKYTASRGRCPPPWPIHAELGPRRAARRGGASAPLPPLGAHRAAAVQKGLELCVPRRLLGGRAELASAAAAAASCSAVRSVAPSYSRPNLTSSKTKPPPPPVFSAAPPPPALLRFALLRHQQLHRLAGCNCAVRGGA